MAVEKFLMNVDMVQNQILQPVIEVLASAPGSPVEGQIYYNSTNESLWLRQNAAWQQLGVGGGSSTFIALTDVGEPDYVGHAGNLVRVNSTPNGLEFVDGSTLYVAAGITTLAGYGISDTMVNFDTAVSDGTFVWAGDTSTAGWSFVIDDDTMVTATATNLASSESIKTYVDNKVAGGMTYKGGFDPTAAAGDGVPDLDTITSTTGDTYTVTAAGTYNWTTGSAVLAIGDVLIAEADGVLNDVANWTIVNKNIPDIVQASETEQGIIQLATQAEVDARTDPDKAVTSATLAGTLGTTATLSAALKYTELIGDNASVTIAVTHNIGSQHVLSQVFEVADGMTRVSCEVENTSTTVTTFKFNTAPTTDQFRVVIIG
jgi:hypothetical protein